MRLQFLLVLAAFAASTACTPITHGQRAAHSSLGCMHTAIAGRPLETVRDDRQAHCIAAGLIARHCSVGEAYLASVGKELRDLLGPGDAEWQDLASDRRGIRCAQHTESDAALLACCEGTAKAGFAGGFRLSLRAPVGPGHNRTQLPTEP